MKILFLNCLAITLALTGMKNAMSDELPEITIIASVDELVSIYQDHDYWGEESPGAILEVPPLLAVVTEKVWSQEAAALTVPVKKEVFYRSLLPLVLYANEVIAADRDRLLALSSSLAHGNPIDLGWLATLAKRYRLLPEQGLPEGPDLEQLVRKLLHRVDTIPATLALGQGAYESGYGTSRFALTGNAYFGQWTYGGKGMAPQQKRASKGNYGVAAYAWPLDSVRAYMMNLNTHRAYQGLRDRRAELREAGKLVLGTDLTPTLINYSERGQEYVDTLNGIIRVNQLSLADDARLLNIPPVLLVNARDAEHAKVVAEEIESLRASGELMELIADMGLVLK